MKTSLLQLFDLCGMIDSWAWTLKSWRRSRKMQASAMVVLVDLPLAFWIQWLHLVLQPMDMDFAMTTAFLRKISAMVGR